MRQLAERQREASGLPTKKFRSMAAPKGAKLPSGYVDRTQQRISEDEDDKAARVKALEEMMKLQQIGQPTFEKLRDEIIGGDVNSVHLMKGLDYKLLERVRRGEDVLAGKANEDEEEQQHEEVDVDEEFEMLEDKEIAPLAKEKSAKHGEMAAPSLVPGKKRNRDQILAEMKAAREEAKAKAGPSLGAKFRKVGAPRTESRIERDSRGREVLITVDEHGNEKRKVRRVQIEETLEEGHGLLMPDKDAKPLGMEVPEIPKPTIEEEEDFDIFENAGDDYDPLAGLDDDDSNSEAEDGEIDEAAKRHKLDQKLTPEEEKASFDRLSMPPPPRPKVAVKARNYFGETTDTTSTTTSNLPALSDPTILAALKKASAIASHTKDTKSEEEEAREAKIKKMLQSQDRDAEDIDMGFGSSRFADEEDFGDEKIKLSNWDGDDDGAEGGKGEKAKRKRGPKKRKGDANSAADVLKVMERRKAEDKS